MTPTSKITRETREEGYQAALPFVASIRERVYGAVRANADGLTAEEVQAAVGCTLNSARSRLTELVKAGRLYVAGKRHNRAGTRAIAVFAARGAP